MKIPSRPPKRQPSRRLFSTASVTPATYPHLPWSELARAMGLLRSGRLAGAFTICERVIEPPRIMESIAALINSPPSGPPLVSDGLLSLLRRRLQREPRDAWAALLAAWIHEKHDEFDQAFQLIDRATPESSGHGWMRFLTGRIHLIVRCDPARARREFAAARASAPLFWKAAAFEAEARVCAGEGAGGLQPLQSSLCRLAPADRAEALSWLGELKVWIGDIPGARADLEVATAAGVPMAWCWAGAAALAGNDPKKAVRALDRGLEVFPRDCEALTLRGEARRLLGRLEAARVDLDEAIGCGTYGNGHPFWASLNSALLRGGEGAPRKAAGDLAAVPREVIGALERATGIRLTRRPDAALMTRFAAAALRLNPGLRRADRYLFPLWAGPLVKSGVRRRV